MQERDLRELLDAARIRVAGVRAALVQPRACPVDECVSRLREAQGYLEWLRDSLSRRPRPDAGLRAQARALSAEIAQAAILLEQAARYGRRWLERLRQPEYDATGAQPLFLPRGSVSFLG